MPLLTAQSVLDRPIFEVSRIGDNDAAISSRKYWQYQKPVLQEFYGSISLRSKALFADARRQLKATTDLKEGWHSYEAEVPTDTARKLAGSILDELERASFPPIRLTASAEGGIALCFIEGHNRAIIEIYNTGEIAAATYADHGEPIAWELQVPDSELEQTINRIRVYLAA